MNTGDEYYWDDRDDDEQDEGQLPHDERVRIGKGMWLIVTTWPDGYTVVGQVWLRPGGGCWIEPG